SVSSVVSNTYLWTISGGKFLTDSTKNSVQVRWNTAGNGTINLQQTDNLGCDTLVSKKVYVKVRPAPVISGPATSCRYQSGLTYSVTSNSGSTYSWSITNGIIQSGQNTNSVSVKWLAPGTGTISVTEA